MSLEIKYTAKITTGHGTTKFEKYVPDSYATWHIGQKNPLDYYEVETVTTIQVDGDELDLVRDMFGNSNNNIPRGRVIRLFGDLAKTIVGNLNN